MIREFCRSVCVRALESRARVVSDDMLTRDAVVFAPHFDDEALGCGGTIALKRQHDADVSVVFMTDGSRSPDGDSAGADLSRRRRAEAVAAGECMGLAEENLVFLDFEESKLSEHREDAIRIVQAILENRPCAEVYVPFSREPNLWSHDHIETFEIVHHALNRLSWSVDVYEYPVWYWYHWPWVSIPLGKRRGGGRIVAHSLANQLGFGTVAWLNRRVALGDTLGLKRKALEQYRSQMQRSRNGAYYPGLKDGANGDFLECFERGSELFRFSHSRIEEGKMREYDRDASSL